MSEPRGGQVERRLPIGKRADDPRAPPDLAQDALQRIVGADGGTRVSPSTVSDLNKKIYATIEAWRNRPKGEHPYVYLDGIVMK